jgi:hypothetical protein
MVETSTRNNLPGPNHGSEKSDWLGQTNIHTYKLFAFFSRYNPFFQKREWLVWCPEIYTSFRRLIISFRLRSWLDEILCSIIHNWHWQTKNKEKIHFFIYAFISPSLSSIWGRTNQMRNAIWQIGGTICCCSYCRGWFIRQEPKKSIFEWLRVVLSEYQHHTVRIWSLVVTYMSHSQTYIYILRVKLKQFYNNHDIA